MGYNVEGKWKNFTFKIIENEDTPKVYEFLKADFMRTERTSQLVGFTDEYFNDFVQLYDWIFSLDDKLSFMAVDNESGQIAGVRITFTNTKETSFAHIQFKSHAMKVLFKIIEIVDQEAKVFEHYGIDRYANFITASTSSQFRNQGLATEMYRRSFPLLRERKFPMVKSVFTSPYSRKCAQNFNFEVLSSVNYKGLKDENGEIMFPEANEADHASLMCLKL